MAESKLNEDITPPEAKASDVNIGVDGSKKKDDSKESDEALINYLMTNPHTGERMSYEESRMMYG